MATSEAIDDAEQGGVRKWIKTGFPVVLVLAIVGIATANAGAGGPLKLANAAIAILAGVFGAMALFWALNKLVELLPPTWEDRFKPYVFIGPALSAIGLFLVFPAVQTVQGSFYNADLSKPVGLQNYVSLFGDSSFRSTLINTLLWTILVPTVTIAFGLLVATLTDKMSAASEKYAKMFIFLPMAISLVG
mgnify:FL=1